MLLMFFFIFSLSFVNFAFVANKIFSCQFFNYCWRTCCLVSFTRISSKNRKFSPTPRLRYSPSTDTVYSCYCALFGTQSNCFHSNDWSNTSKFINRHNAVITTQQLPEGRPIEHYTVMEGRTFCSNCTINRLRKLSEIDLRLSLSPKFW